MIKKLYFLTLIYTRIFSMGHSISHPEWCKKTLAVLQQEIESGQSNQHDISNQYHKYTADIKKLFVKEYSQLCEALLKDLDNACVESGNWISTTSNPHEAGKSPWGVLVYIKQKDAYTPYEIDALKREIPDAWQHYQKWSKMGPL